MKVIERALDGVLVIEHQVFSDSRGVFFEGFNAEKFAAITDLKVNFVQDNFSTSKKNVLRGMHYQIPPKAQGKLVRVVSGEVFDVVVDLRGSSRTFGQWFGCVLSDKNRRSVWIPPGFAHGFFVLSDCADFFYKTTDFYSPENERCICWNDPEIGIAWPNEREVILSDKDKLGESLRRATVF